MTTYDPRTDSASITAAMPECHGQQADHDDVTVARIAEAAREDGLRPSIVWQDQREPIEERMPHVAAVFHGHRIVIQRFYPGGPWHIHAEFNGNTVGFWLGEALSLEDVQASCLRDLADAARDVLCSLQKAGL